MKDLVFVTGNAHKAAFLSKWLGRAVKHQKLDLTEIQSLDTREIAEHKARQAYELLKCPVLVEDVGLKLLAIDPLPGPFIKWFVEVGIDKICRLLDGFDDRRAEAYIVYALFDGRTCRFFEGSIKGVIADQPRGEGGFGFDPILISDGYTITRAEMDETTHAATSHRAQAMQKLRDFLDKDG